MSMSEMGIYRQESRPKGHRLRNAKNLVGVRKFGAIRGGEISVCRASHDMG